MARTQDRQQNPRLQLICLKVPPIFNEAQVSLANHRKNCVALYKLHEEAWGIVEEKKGKLKAVGGKAFRDTFFISVTRMLGVKKGKGEVNAERVAKFMAAYVQHVNEKDAENGDDEDGLGGRFTKALLRFLMDGFQAGNKTVRYRCVNALYEMVRHLGTLDLELYRHLRDALLDRLQDRENSVRAEASAALAILCAAGEDGDSDEDEGLLVHETLYELMGYDDAVEVRKAILCNIGVNEESLKHIILRIRDTDASIRRAVFQQVLKARIFQKDSPGPCHPSNLDKRYLLEIMRHGLRDRDSNVVRAAEVLMKGWLEAYEVSLHEVKPDSDSFYRKDRALVALLQGYDLHACDSNDLTVLETMIKGIFKLRPDILDAMEFGDIREWETRVLPEKAFLTRVYVQHCLKANINDEKHDILPSVGRMAFLIDHKYKAFVNLCQDESSSEISVAKETYLLAELLRIGALLDYGDHIGANKMRLIICNLVSDEELPEGFIPLCLDVLRKVAADEKDLIRLGVEIIQGMRENPEDDEEQPQDPDASLDYEPREERTALCLRPRADMDPDLKLRLDTIDLRALKISRALFERIDTTFKKLPPLMGIFHQLIVPMMKYAVATLRSMDLEEADKERYQELLDESVYCVSLSAQISETIAWASYTGFVKLVEDQDTEKKIVLLLLKAMFDMVLVYRSSLVPPDSPITFEDVLDHLIGQIREQSADPAALTVVCGGLAKLAFDGVIHKKGDILEMYHLLIVPETADNAELRQSLNFFFQIYSHLHPYNQMMMADIFMDLFIEAGNMRRTQSEPGAAIISPDLLCRLFEDYTAPLVDDAKKEKFRLKDDVHLRMADTILEALFETIRPGEKEPHVLEKNDKKALFLCLSRLQLPEKADGVQLLRVKLQMEKLATCRPPRDAVCRTAFQKFVDAFNKKYEKEVEVLESDDYRKYEQLQRLFEFLDEIIPEDEEVSQQNSNGPITRGKKRRSMSTTNSEMEDIKPVIDVEEQAESIPNKRRRVSTTPASPSSPPQNGLAGRKKESRRVSIQPDPDEVIVISSDSDEEPPPPRDARARSSCGEARQTEEEVEDDSVIDDLSDQLSQNVSLVEQTFDSIMDSDPPEDEEEEDEVSRNLIEDSD